MILCAGFEFCASKSVGHAVLLFETLLAKFSAESLRVMDKHMRKFVSQCVSSCASDRYFTSYCHDSFCSYMAVPCCTGS